MIQNVPFSPNLYTTAWNVFLNDLHDLRLKCKLAFPSLGRRCWGWVYKNQYQNEHQIAYPCGYCTCFDNDETRVILTQPLHHRMPVLRNVSCDLQAMQKNTTKTCKNCNELKTPHICWLQSYLEYEWEFPRVQTPELLFQTDIKTSKKASNGNQRQLHWPQNEIHKIHVCTSVGKNEMIIGYMDLKNKIVSYYTKYFLYGKCTYTLQVIHLTLFMSLIF